MHPKPHKGSHSSAISRATTVASRSTTPVPVTAKSEL